MKADPVVECPCFHICSTLGVKTSPWCRYQKSAAPPVGMHRFDPQDTWCPGGVQANVMMLGYMLVGQNRDAAALEPALDRVREWAATLRQQPHGHDTAGR